MIQIDEQIEIIQLYIEDIQDEDKRQFVLDTILNLQKEITFQQEYNKNLIEDIEFKDKLIKIQKLEIQGLENDQKLKNQEIQEYFDQAKQEFNILQLKFDELMKFQNDSSLQQNMSLLDDVQIKKQNQYVENFDQMLLIKQQQLKQYEELLNQNHQELKTVQLTIQNTQVKKNHQSTFSKDSVIQELFQCYQDDDKENIQQPQPNQQIKKNNSIQKENQKQAFSQQFDLDKNKLQNNRKKLGSIQNQMQQIKKNDRFRQVSLFQFNK